ncbi:hypothetical protein [Aliivibrio salmonicida]|uniref:hypothetical protein n=1 Tax=Aliivibrio salmonicida TaxID=40269 RepID=UPI003D0BCAA4
MSISAQTYPDQSGLILHSSLQYGEPSTSSALNKNMHNIASHGIYIGFDYSLIGGMKVRIASNGDQHTLVARHTSHSLTIHAQHSYDLTIPNGLKSFVVIDSFFQHGIKTKQVDNQSNIEATEYKILQENELLPHHVIIVSFNVPNGTATLTESMASIDRRSIGGFGIDEHNNELNPHPQYMHNDEHASEAEAIAGVTAAKWISPLRWMQAFKSRLSNSFAGTRTDYAVSEKALSDGLNGKYSKEEVDTAIAELNRSLLMTEAQSLAIRNVSSNEFAASGWVNSGKAFIDNVTYNPINEGLYTELSEPNSLRLGRRDSDGVGTSKTPYAVTYIAGFVSKILNINYSNPDILSNVILFPEAPNGTVIYDSTGNCRGTGKANLDLTKDVDPKYGDVAADVNEAVARAFEGATRNGDFRNAADNWEQSGGKEFVITTGSATLINATAPTYLLNTTDSAINSKFIVEVVCSGVVGESWISLGSGGTKDLLLKNGVNTVTGISTGYQKIYVSANAGASLTLHSFWFKTPTEEVVINRVDMFGLEQWLEVIKGDEVFTPCIQDQSATFGDTGIPTVNSARPKTYFAVYDGHDAPIGKCVKWPTLTYENKAKVVAYLGAGFFINTKGELVQVRIAQDTKRGLGNGNWFNINPSDGALLYRNGTPVLSRKGFAFVQDKENQGVFTDGNGSNYLVMGTTPRLNQGAYHQFNPLGTGKIFSATQETNFGNWNEANRLDINSLRDCFDFGDYPNVGFAHKAYKSGFISGFGSGREDGRLYDAIHADGLGGVIDVRKPAQNTGTPEYQSWARERVKNGSYRGLEKLVYSKPSVSTILRSGTYKGYSYIRVQGIFAPPSDGNIGAVGHVVSEAGVIYKIFASYSVNSVNETEWKVRPVNGFGIVDLSSFANGKKCYALTETKTETSISGNFTNQVVFAEPAHLLACPDLASGWHGIWGGIPNGTAGFLVRKQKGSNRLQAFKTVAPFTEWTDEVGCVETSKNDTDQALTSGGVYLFPMTNFAKQTKESTNKPVLNGSVGVGEVFQYCWNWVGNGNLLAESLIEKVLTNSANVCDVYANKRLQSLSITSNDGSIQGFQYAPLHSPFTVGIPTNNSPAVKVLDYMFNDNGQVNLGFQANELTYDDSSFVPWGDDETMKITNSGESTFTDLNGHLNKQAVQELSISLGYTFTSSEAGVGGATSSIGSYYGALAPYKA